MIAMRSSRSTKLQKSELRFRSIIQSAIGAVILTNSKGKIILWNKAAEHIFGYPKKKMLGKHLSRIIPEMAQFAFDSKPSFIGKIIEMQGLQKMGAELPLEASLSSWKIGDERFWAIMLRDITRRKRNEEEIARYITKMKEIDRAKSEFISLASHQLRTPLTNINLAAEILLRDASGGMNNEQKKYLKEICNDIKRMAELIKTLLNVSRIELGNFLIELKLESLPEVVKNTLKEILPQIKNKKLKLEKSFLKDLPKINIDRNLIKIALQNLLSNAVKYTDRNGIIRVEVKKDNRNAIISVSDTGCGIPKNQQDKIFSKMFRADNVSEKTEGLGLGLYIVKSIIEQSGSKIWFESEINKGTTFYIAVPLSGMAKKIS